jgi:hypothetical protein
MLTNRTAVDINIIIRFSGTLLLQNIFDVARRNIESVYQEKLAIQLMYKPCRNTKSTDYSAM